MRAALGAPTDGDAVAAAFRRVLADHRNPEGDERPNAANCVHLEDFGTRSSCIVRVGPGAAHPGCGSPTAPVHDALRGRQRVLGLRAAAAPAAQSRTSGL